ncbi:hypothetical protein B0O99DRAFT_589459 [Bisporella sp. PMI_857]|nr:hypothetical protein B0O99DRAFT_589459 [Bisporella sp. PMI_857]
MASPVVSTTIQACILAGTSCLIGQAITIFKSDAPFTIDFTQLAQFIAFTILTCPPNFLWQTYLESTFPAARLVPSKSAISAASNSNEKELDREQKADEILEHKLHIPNTITKFILDQTIGAAANTLLFSFIFAGFKGATLDQAIQISKQDFWGLMSAGWRLWPAVSLLNFTVVKSVEKRNLVGGFAGMIWGVYLALVSSRN